MADLRANQKVDPVLHEKMKEIAKKKGETISDVYHEAITEYIKAYYEEEVIKNSKLDDIITEQFRKMDRHLASMLGRTGMDVAMILQGLVTFLENYFKGAKKEDIFETLRKDAARYYTQDTRNNKS